MSDYCKDKILCPNGNCPGCKNKEKWCNDPRCTPYCHNCKVIVSYNIFTNIFFAFLTFILIVSLVMLILFKGRFILNDLFRIKY